MYLDLVLSEVDAESWCEWDLESSFASHLRLLSSSNTSLFYHRRSSFASPLQYISPVMTVDISRSDTMLTTSSTTCRGRPQHTSPTTFPSWWNLPSTIWLNPTVS